MNSKRVQALRYYLMSLSEKRKLIRSLPNEIATELLQYVRELDELIPANITEKEKMLLIERIVEDDNQGDSEWKYFTESVFKEMARLNTFPDKLRRALME